MSDGQQPPQTATPASLASSASTAATGDGERPAKHLTAEAQLLIDEHVDNVLRKKATMLGIGIAGAVALGIVTLNAIVDQQVRSRVEDATEKARQELRDKFATELQVLEARIAADRERIAAVSTDAQEVAKAITAQTSEVRERLAGTLGNLEAQYANALRDLEAKQQRLGDLVAQGETVAAQVRARLDSVETFYGQNVAHIATALAAEPAFLDQLETRALPIPLGTVIASLLPPGDFHRLTEPGATFDPTVTKWVLADGRDVTGSRFQKALIRRSVPDLRGLFLRGANEGRADGRQDPGPRELDGYQADGNLTHHHPLSERLESAGFLMLPLFHDEAHKDWDPKGNTLPPDCQLFADPNTFYKPEGPRVDLTRFQHVQTSRSGTVAVGGPEARPRNMVVYFYIRIN